LQRALNTASPFAGRVALSWAKVSAALPSMNVKTAQAPIQIRLLLMGTNSSDPNLQIQNLI
jgi:hypothetical protein